MKRLLFVSGLTVAAGSALVSCGSGLVSTTGIGRKTRVFTQGIGNPPLPVGTPNPNGPCVNSDGTPCAQIGHVTAHNAQPDPSTDGIWFEWDPADVGSTQRYLGQVRRLDKALLGCVSNNGLLIVTTAQAVAAYVTSPQGKALASVTSDLVEYAQLYLIGAATPLEFLGAAAAVMSLTDWFLMLSTLGISATVMYVIMRCAVDAYPSTT